MGRPKHPELFTPAEQRVLEGLRAGRSNVDIAIELGLSINTVKYHVANMLAKSGARDRSALGRLPGEAPSGQPRPWRRLLGGAAMLAAASSAAGVIVLWLAIRGATSSGGALPTGRLAYQQYDDATREGRVVVVAAESGRILHLTNAVPTMFLSPTWSPDGRRLAYLMAPTDAGQFPLAADAGSERDTSFAALVVEDAAIGGGKLVGSTASVATIPGIAARPVWRPDGGLLVYGADDFLARTTSSDHTDEADQWLGVDQMAWSANGSYGVVGTNGHRPTLFHSDANFRSVADAERVELPAAGALANFAFSPDGHRLAWQRTVADGTTHVFVGPGPLRPPAPEVGDAWSYDGAGVLDLGVGVAPSWSPDGTRLVFATAEPSWWTTLLGGSAQILDRNIMVHDFTRNRTVVVTQGAAGDFWPAWSPDGQWIAFLSDRAEPGLDVYVVRSDGSGLRRLTQDGGQKAQLAWSPK